MNDCCSLSPSQIVIYTTQHCPDCRRVKVFFDTNHITYDQIQIEDNEQAADFVAELNHGCHSVPTIIFPDGTILVEPGWEELKAKFN